MNKSLASSKQTTYLKNIDLGTIGMTSLREDLSRWLKRDKTKIAKNGPNKAGIEQSRMINDHEFWPYMI